LSAKARLGATASSAVRYEAQRGVDVLLEALDQRWALRELL
jgi:hypothetical protein